MVWLEIRVLEYFLAVAREQSISAAAASLHLSQPTLSTQLKGLEEELGKQLLVRGTKGSRRVTLTEEGMLLRKRAEEILSLVRRTEQEIAQPEEAVAGEVFIAAGETEAFRLVARTVRRLRLSCPEVRVHIASGNATFVLEQLERGLIDFGILYGAVDRTRYEAMELPLRDQFGVLMRRDAPLAERPFITPEELRDKPLILSRQEERDGWPILSWLGREISQLTIAATYTLIYNASLLVDEGVGYAVCFDHLVHTEGTGLTFKPLSPPLEAGASVVWKKYQSFSRAAGRFLEELRREKERG